MKTVKCHIVEKWAWECPECGEWNETEESDMVGSKVICDGCDKEFWADKE